MSISSLIFIQIPISAKESIRHQDKTRGNVTLVPNNLWCTVMFYHKNCTLHGCVKKQLSISQTCSMVLAPGFLGFVCGISCCQAAISEPRMVEELCQDSVAGGGCALYRSAHGAKGQRQLQVLPSAGCSSRTVAELEGRTADTAKRLHAPNN